MMERIYFLRLTFFEIDTLTSPSELVNVARERVVWGPLLELLPP